MKILQYDWYDYADSDTWSSSSAGVSKTLSGCQIVHIGIQFPRAYPLYLDLQTPEDVCLEKLSEQVTDENGNTSKKEITSVPYSHSLQPNEYDTDNVTASLKTSGDFIIRFNDESTRDKHYFKVNRNNILEFDEELETSVFSITKASNLTIPFGTLIEIGYESLID